jgi:hypothetical protein
LNINGFTGKAFTFGRTSSYMMDGGVRQDWVAVRLEAYVHAHGKSFSFVGEHFDPERTNDLDKLVAKLRAVPTGAVPTAPGLCFGPGMLLDPIGADEAEKVVLFAGLPGHPDIRIAFNTMAGLKRTWPTLLQRDAQAAAKEPLWMRALFSPLRSGPRTINGLAGEEAVMKVTELNFSVVYGLDWELPGTEGNVLEPAIHLEMSTGNNPAAGGPPVQSTLGQQALLDLWDKIASSIRVRPTASAAAASVPLLLPGRRSVHGRPQASRVRKQDGGPALTAAPAWRCTAARASTCIRASACQRHCCCRRKPYGRRCVGCSQATRAMTGQSGRW